MSTEWCKMHLVLCSRVLTLHVPETHGVLLVAPRGSRGHSKDWTVTLENVPSPSALRDAVGTVGGGLVSAMKPLLRLRQGPPSRMVLLMVADVVRLLHVTHSGLAARDPSCGPPLQGVVSPQSVELPEVTKVYIQHRWCKSHLVLWTRVSILHLPKSPKECFF